MADAGREEGRMKFFPGGPFIEQTIYGEFFSVIDEAGNIVAFVRSGKRSPDGPRNARLIAAAPDMYTACRAILDGLRSRKGTDEEGRLSFRELRLLKAALSLADGSPDRE